jgi:hypothetical protein
VPTIVPSPGTVNAQIERTSTLLCRTAGIPKPKVQWLKNAKPIGENGAGRYTKLPDDSLLIKGKCAKENNLGNLIRNFQNNQKSLLQMSNWRTVPHSRVWPGMNSGNSESTQIWK